MKTESWTTHLIDIHRADDGERIGFLREGIGGTWEPLNLLGMALADATDRDRAEASVREYSMSSLLGQLWCKIPRPLMEDVTDAGQEFHEAWWERVSVVEITPTSVTIKPYYPMEEEQTKIVIIQLPADGRLKFKEPTEDQGK